VIKLEGKSNEYESITISHEWQLRGIVTFYQYGLHVVLGGAHILKNGPRMVALKYNFNQSLCIDFSFSAYFALIY